METMSPFLQQHWPLLARRMTYERVNIFSIRWNSVELMELEQEMEQENQSLKLGDASIASPFTCKSTAIDSGIS